MILTGSEVEEQLELGNISLVPFSEKLINPNSYNYRLGKKLLLIKDSVIDTKYSTTVEEIEIPPEGYVLLPNHLYLGHTFETIGSDKFVPSLIGRSSLGRLGLFLQITADLGHLGTKHKWTLELKVVQPLRIYFKMKIGQVSFWKPETTHSSKKINYRNLQGSYSSFSQSTPSIISKFFI